MDIGRFLRELRRRNVYKVAIVYGVTAWLLAQIVDLATDSFNAPEWVMKMFWVFLLSGFPIALILAWAFELSPQGFIRTTSPASDENTFPEHKKKPLTSNIFIAILIVAIIGQFMYFKYYSDQKNKVVQETTVEKSIAVLPFVNDSDVESNRFFCNGLMEGILDHLQKIPDLRVISRTSVEQYRERNKTAREIAQELGVVHILEGSVQRDGDRAQIFAQLIHAERDDHVWSKRYNRNIEDVFKVQNEITRIIADSLKSKISPELARRMAVPPTGKLEAFELVNRGRDYQFRYLADRNETNLNSAEKLFKEAISLDSSYALAYVGLGFVNWARTGYINNRSIEAPRYIDSLRHYAEKTLEYDENLAQGHHLYGLHLLQIGDWEGAYERMKKAAFLNPNLPQAYEALSLINYEYYYNVPQAIEDLKIALSIMRAGPVRPLLIHELGKIYRDLGLFSKAEAYTREAISISPDYVLAYNELAWLASIQGKFDKALALADTVCVLYEEFYDCLGNLADNHTWSKNFETAEKYWIQHEQLLEEKGVINMAVYPNKAYVFRHLGKDEKAEELFKKSLAHHKDMPNGVNSYFSLAEMYAAMNDRDNALENLLKHHCRYGGFHSFIQHSPIFEILWGDPEFEKFVNKLEKERSNIWSQLEEKALL